jgi:two-component system, NarL family, nitrate/nitrite response regulator NarL
MKPVSTLLIDPHRLFRQGLVRLLEATRYHVVAEYASIEEAMRSPVPHAAPRLVLVDPSGDDPQSIAQLRAAMPDARLVMLSSNVNLERLRRAGELPVQGYLTKELEPGELTSALDRVMDGQILIPAIMVPLVVTPPRPSTAPRGLTVREAEILRRLVNGDSNRMIATHLSLSEMVVKASVKQLLRKIKAANRTQAALWAIHQGFDRPQARSA